MVSSDSAPGALVIWRNELPGWFGSRMSNPWLVSASAIAPAAAFSAVAVMSVFVSGAFFIAVARPEPGWRLFGAFTPAATGWWCLLRPLGRLWDRLLLFGGWLAVMLLPEFVDKFGCAGGGGCLAGECEEGALQALHGVVVGGDGDVPVVAAVASDVGVGVVGEAQDGEPGADDVLGCFQAQDLDGGEGISGGGGEVVELGGHDGRGAQRAEQRGLVDDGVQLAVAAGEFLAAQGDHDQCLDLVGGQVGAGGPDDRFRVAGGLEEAGDGLHGEGEYFAGCGFQADVFAGSVGEDVVVVGPPSFALAFPCQVLQVAPLPGVVQAVGIKHDLNVTGPGRRFPGLDAREGAGRDVQPGGDVLEPVPE